MSLREEFAKNIQDVLKNMSDPRPGLVTREFFDAEKLAITQFPALLVLSGDEERADYTMGVTRQGNIIYTIRGFVRGSEIDKLRNELVERIEETLDEDRTRGTLSKSMTTQITRVIVADRLAPLGEVAVTVQVRYKYTKGVN
tara:strand:+ start:938 stop:1363 length:426 start_codon:yes stop_codon:yes gene_type:complete